MKTKLLKTFLAAVGLAVSVAVSAAPTTFVFKRIAPGVACAGTGCDLQAEIAASGAPAPSFNVALVREQMRALARGAVLGAYEYAQPEMTFTSSTQVQFVTDDAPVMDGALFGLPGTQVTGYDLNTRLHTTLPVSPTRFTVPAYTRWANGGYDAFDSWFYGTPTYGTYNGQPALSGWTASFESHVTLTVTPEACAAIGAGAGVSCSNGAVVATASGTFITAGIDTTPPDWMSNYWSIPWPM